MAPRRKNCDEQLALFGLASPPTPPAAAPELPSAPPPAAAAPEPVQAAPEPVLEQPVPPAPPPAAAPPEPLPEDETEPEPAPAVDPELPKIEPTLPLPAWAAGQVANGVPLAQVEARVREEIEQHRAWTRRSVDRMYVNLSGGPMTFGVLEPNDNEQRRPCYSVCVVRHAHVHLAEGVYERAPIWAREGLVPVAEAAVLVRSGDVKPSRMLCGSLIACGLMAFDDPIVIRTERAEQIRAEREAAS